MKRRTAIELIFGVLVAAAFFYWLYVRPRAEQSALPVDSPALADRAETVHPKVLIIGIDGLSWEPLLQFANAGLLPNFSRLAAGPHGILTSAPPLVSSVSWTTLATGQPPAVHGITDIAAKAPFQYREARLGSRDRRAPALWEMAARSGRKVALINWPGADAESIPGGIFIAENTDPARPGPGQVLPADWAEMIAGATRPSFPSIELDLVRIRDQRLARAYELDAGIYAAAELILRKAAPDLMMVQFGNLSMVSRGFWQYRWPLGFDHAFDPSAPDLDRYRDAIENHYLLLDHLIGGLMAAAPGYTVIVVSAYGQAPSFPPANIRLELNRLLDRLGWLEFDSPSCERILEGMIKRGELSVPWPPAEKAMELCEGLRRESEDWVARGEELMAAPAVEAFIGVQYEVREPADDREAELRLTLMTNLARSLLPGRQRPDLVWAKSRAWNTRDFRLDTRGIYLNVEGREPEGAVPRDDYSSQRRALIKELKSLRTDSGRRLFLEVRANPDKDLFPFGAPDPADILVRVDPAALVEEYVFRDAGDNDPIPLGALRWSYGDVSADNYGEGVVMVAGDGFLRQDLDALDFAPALLNHLGLAVGADMPGRPVTDLLPSPEPIFIRSWNQSRESIE